ncbi:amidohydrolase family protein [Kribbella antiqua]|uniref:Amidohydrolase family protein n=1 Tax=Kribbella antiqua TaxID=2512217 RepID=A0A4R2ID87_9ACTN|nr:amidohydrolase family protein [Kribbella antiqua]TCO42563.1 amidohydrolase family protein [Kribbella antiqua]
MADFVVDVHCHVFNADDLPVRGFVQRLHLHTPALGPLLATLIDRVVQGAAPGYAEDMARIRRLLATGGETVADVLGPATFGAAAGLESVGGLESQTDVAFDDLLAQDPIFVRRLSSSLETELRRTGTGTDAGAPSAEGWTDRLADARRAVRWAKLFGLSRLDLAAELVRNSSAQVDLFCPLLVDLDTGLGDRAKTTLRQQVELFEGISSLSMLGRLPGVDNARLHPFIGFDPRRQVNAVLAGLAETPFDVVKSAVLEHGFVGVKVYPPMGWLPLGNTATIDMTATEAVLVDSELRKFYDWCQTEQVPITAHANRSNYADDSFKDFAGPVGWTAALREFPGLRVNLGHFGGARANEPASGWPWRMAKLAVANEHVYADVGNHRIDDTGIARAYFAMLGEMMAATAKTAPMTDRLMFGSDWFMQALLPAHDQFLDSYRSQYRKAFGVAATKRFLGRNALRFLGFDDPGNRNAMRLRQRYQLLAPDRIPDWLA